MKTKTYWWRIATFLLSGSILFLGWFYDNYLCFSLYNPECLFDQYRLVLIEPAVIFSIFLLIISPFLFFINDKIFLKWLRFAGVWIVLSILAIIKTAWWSVHNGDKDNESHNNSNNQHNAKIPELPLCSPGRHIELL